MSLPLDMAGRPGSAVTIAERRALEAMLRHGTVKSAAYALGKSPKTVENQLANARSRLEVRTTIEAVRRVFIGDDIGK